MLLAWRVCSGFSHGLTWATTGLIPQSNRAQVGLTLHRFEGTPNYQRRLRRRHDNRLTLEFNDEYDVQDLLHALLLIDFDDVRSESWNPTYLGGASRTDFLLPDSGVVIEVKKTRPTLLDRKLGSELAEDVTRYSDPAADRGATTLIVSSTIPTECWLIRLDLNVIWQRRLTSASR